MRVLVATVAERTHFLGLVPLAWALRAAGHEVLVASQPELARTVSYAGLAYVPVGRDHHFGQLTRRVAQGRMPLLNMAEDRDEVLTWPHLRDGYRQIVAMWWRTVNDPMAGDLVALCQAWRPDLVLWEATTFSGAVAARVCGAAHVRFLWRFDLFARMRGRFLARLAQLPEGEREDPLAQWLGGLAGRYGARFDEELVVGQATVDHVPTPLRPSPGVAVRYLPMRYLPYNGRAVVPAWLRTPSERPRVCLSLGTAAADRFGSYAVDIGAVLRALGDVDAEIVATLPAAQHAGLGALPPNARLVDFVPLHALTATCTAAIGHGGTGTTWTGLAGGLPQLVVPRDTFDESLLCSLVEQSEAGRVSQPDGDSVRSGLETLLADPRYTRGAALLGRAMRAQPAPAAVAARLHDQAVAGGQVTRSRAAGAVR